MAFIVHNHYHGSDPNAIRLLNQILKNQETILMKQTEAEKKLDALIAQSAENNAENQKNFDDLKKALEDEGNVTPAIEEKLATLEASLKAGDEITPDVE